MPDESMMRICAAFAVLCLPFLAHSQHYYVDSLDGNDSSVGSLNEPWRSLQPVNSTNFQPGDRIHLLRDRAFASRLDLNLVGNESAPIVFTAYGNGLPPKVPELRLSGTWLVIEKLDVDHRSGNNDAVRIRNLHNAVLQDLEIQNSRKDGVDVVGASNLTLSRLHIHHMLAGSYTNQVDAHGIALSNAHNVEIHSVDIHHVSGDSIQIDPNRTPGEIASDIRISSSKLWTGPLQEDFSTYWVQGQTPGENALDTKVLKSGYENEARMQIKIVDVSAFGWSKGSYVSNRAAFNLKEKVQVNMDRVTVYDSEIAFRIRGGLGNANAVITNALIYDVDVAFRCESNLENLMVNHITLGHGVGDVLKPVAMTGGFDSWEWKNVATVTADPDLAALPASLVTAADFIDSRSLNYRPIKGSTLIDSGEASPVTTDRLSVVRDSVPDIGAFEYAASIPLPPQLLPQ